jgi:hypothetical protein
MLFHRILGCLYNVEPGQRCLTTQLHQVLGLDLAPPLVERPHSEHGDLFDRARRSLARYEGTDIGDPVFFPGCNIFSVLGEPSVQESQDSPLSRGVE